MFRKKCDECKKVAWFWQSGWHYETLAEAERRESRNPYMMQLKAKYQNSDTPWKATRQNLCPDCLNKARGYILATKSCSCCKCGKSVTPQVPKGFAWYDAELAGWCCTACKAVSCGECATAKVQELKAKYRAHGAGLKVAIDSDPMAIVGTGEVAPRCPKCNKQQMLMYGKAPS